MKGPDCFYCFPVGSLFDFSERYFKTTYVCSSLRSISEINCSASFVERRISLQYPGFAGEKINISTLNTFEGAVIKIDRGFNYIKKENS